MYGNTFWYVDIDSFYRFLTADQMVPWLFIFWGASILAWVVAVLSCSLTHNIRNVYNMRLFCSQISIRENRNVKHTSLSPQKRRQGHTWIDSRVFLSDFYLNRFLINKIHPNGKQHLYFTIVCMTSVIWKAKKLLTPTDFYFHLSHCQQLLVSCCS